MKAIDIETESAHKVVSIDFENQIVHLESSEYGRTRQDLDKMILIWENAEWREKNLSKNSFLANVRCSLPSLDDATKVATRISEEAIKPPLNAKEQAMFIAGFQECIKWLNVVFSNDR